MVFSYGYFGRTPGQDLKPVPPSREALDALNKQLTGALEALQAMEKARDAAIIERNTARGERDTARGERNTVIAERNTAIGERNFVIGERDTARGERNTAIGERDTARRDAVDLSTRLTNRENAYGILQANLTDVQGVLKAAVDAQIALGKERDVAKGERDTARAAGADLSSRLTAKENALAALQGNLDQMRQAWQAALDAKAQAEAANAAALAGAQQNADEKLLKAQQRLTALERDKMTADALAVDLRSKMETLRTRYDARLAAEAAQAQAALTAAQGELQKARDVCAADLGAAREAKASVDALLATAQADVADCRTEVGTKRSAIEEGPPAPAVSPMFSFIGGAIAGFAASKVTK